MILDELLILAAAPLGVWSVLWDILVLLAMALVLGTVAERLGQSVIVGYLIAGMLVGPNALGWISTQGELFNIAELGVALLLFAIGLEFSPRRLLSLVQPPRPPSRQRKPRQRHSLRQSLLLSRLSTLWQRTQR